MPNFASWDSAIYLLALTTPGIVFLFFRAQFTTGRVPRASEAALHYLAITALYYTLLYPFIGLAQGIQGNSATRWFGWASLLFVIPALLGGIVGIAAHREFIYRLLRRCGMDPVHVYPSAWEWTAANCPGDWVLVTLKGGRRFGGRCNQRMFFSTDPAERDVFLDETYDLDDNDEWVPRRNSILISAGEISTLEFWK